MIIFVEVFPFVLEINKIFKKENKTRWFGILAGYYLILAVMQFLLLKYAIKKGIGKSERVSLKNMKIK